MSNDEEAVSFVLNACTFKDFIHYTRTIDIYALLIENS